MDMLFPVLLRFECNFKFQHAAAEAEAAMQRKIKIKGSKRKANGGLHCVLSKERSEQTVGHGLA